MQRWWVLACMGCGSAIVEAALTLAEIRYDREEHDYSTPRGRQVLLAFNPLAQVPTVILPDGTVMTETAAIVLHLDALAPQARLLPAIGDPLRPEALRWLMFLIAAVYPTFTYGDEPAKWVGAAGDVLRRTTDEHRAKLWQDLETVARGPWFLVARFSAIDLYIAVMSRWRPKRGWFAERCPRLHAIAVELDRDPRLATAWATSFS
jgi:GST-like protein